MHIERITRFTRDYFLCWNDMSRYVQIKLSIQYSMMDKEVSTKIVNFMTFGVEVLVLGCAQF